MTRNDATEVSDAFRTSQPLPDVPGLVLRHLRRPDDYPRMNEIANATRATTGSDFTTTDEQFQIFYDHPSDFDRDRDVVIVEVDGRIVGYVRGGIHQEVDGPLIHEILPLLDPALPPEPLLPLMLEVMEDHLRDLAAAKPGDNVLETFGGDSAPDREAIVLRAGYVPIRYGYSMVRPHLDDLPDAPLPGRSRDPRGPA